MSRKHLLLLHGALGARTQFDPLLPLLDRGILAHAIDFEGHGNAPLGDRPFRTEHFAENVLTYLDRNAIETTYIFGHSLGGVVGLYLANYHPERVAGVFALGIKFRWTPAIAERENSLLDPEKMKEKVPEFANMLEKRHQAASWLTLLDKTREMNTYIGGNVPLPDPFVKSISTRVRISLGDRDKMVSMEETLELYRLLQNGEFQVFPRTAHPLERVPMPKLARSIEDFLE